MKRSLIRTEVHRRGRFKWWTDVWVWNYVDGVEPHQLMLSQIHRTATGARRTERLAKFLLR